MGDTGEKTERDVELGEAGGAGSPTEVGRMTEERFGKGGFRHDIFHR